MHATFADLRDALGDQRLAARTVSGSPSTPEVVWTRRLAAASGVVDATLRRAGYSVPVDYASLSGGSEGEEAEGVRAILREATINEAVALAEIGVSTEPGAPVQAFKETRNILTDILRGRIRLPMAITRKSIGSVPLPTAQRAPGPDLDNVLFEANRTVLD